MRLAHDEFAAGSHSSEYESSVFAFNARNARLTNIYDWSMRENGAVFHPFNQQLHVYQQGNLLFI